jgi:hypothetical protein
MWISRALKRLPQLWRHRREVWWAIKDAGSARVDRKGIVWIPTSDYERRVASMMLNWAAQAEFVQKNPQVADVVRSFARRLAMADVATRGEVQNFRDEHRPAPIGI